MADIKIGGVPIACLVDTGSMVSTITESFFKAHFQVQGHDQLRSCGWLQLRAANGLDIPYRGYLELDIEVLGKVLPSMGILVVHDPPDSGSRLKKKHCSRAYWNECASLLSARNVLSREQEFVCFSFLRCSCGLETCSVGVSKL